MIHEVPTLATAEHLLHQGTTLNPGFGWVEHSRFVADAAGRIAAIHPDLDEEQARVLGLLHDIGRREGHSHNRHIIDGYQFLHQLNYESAARICLTHSFPVKNISYAAGQWDTTAGEYDFIRNYLESITYNDYDRLLQLCDAIALPTGFCLLEKRMVDIGLRHGVNERTVERWQALFDLKGYFEAALGQSIYSLLPGIAENTFDFNHS